MKNYTKEYMVVEFKNVKNKILVQKIMELKNLNMFGEIKKKFTKNANNILEIKCGVLGCK